MTQAQKDIADYFKMLIEDHGSDYFEKQQEICFSELFKFKGLLGQGSYGVVIVV
jgi:anti-sigma regulatory factor (Ser/Thr protein kinase)